MKPKIGILSGYGPLAGVDVLQKILKYAADEYGAIEDSEYPNIVLVSQGALDFGSEANLSQEFKNQLKHSLKNLCFNKPTVIGIACNTAHIYFKELQRETAVQSSLVNLPMETASLANPAKKYLLLNSKASREMYLYDSYLGQKNIQYIKTKSEDQIKVDKIIKLVMAHNLQQASEYAYSLVKSYGTQVSGVIAGCTELPLALDWFMHDSRLEYIDSNFVLAKALTDCYYKQKTASNCYTKTNE